MNFAVQFTTVLLEYDGESDAREVAVGTSSSPDGIGLIRSSKIGLAGHEGNKK